MTRKTLTDFMDSCKDEICIIPAQLFGDFLQGIKERDEKFLATTEKLCQTQNKLCETLDRIASNMESAEETDVPLSQMGEDPQDLHQSLMIIGEKIDKLTEAVKIGASNIQKQSAGDNDLKTAKDNIRTIKDLRGKFLRSEKLSAYYEELYKRDLPFVQAKFRVHVNNSIPDYELDIRKEEAIGNATREVRLMQVRMREWSTKIDDLRQEVALALSSPTLSDIQRKACEEEMTKDEEENQKEREEAFNKIKTACETELQSGETQFLLKYVQNKSTKRSRWNQGGDSGSEREYDEYGNIQDNENGRGRNSKNFNPTYRRRPRAGNRGSRSRSSTYHQ